MATHNFQLTQNNVPVTHVVAGKSVSGVVTAACNNNPAVVTVKNYTFNGDIFIDGHGYRPTITTNDSEARSPIFIKGIYNTATNPIPFFVAANSDAKQNTSVTATATRDPCSTLDASGNVSFDVSPLTKTPLNFFNHARLTEFKLSEFLYFGVGTEADNGFRVEYPAELLQSDTNRWIRVIDNPNFVLDVKPDAKDFILDPAQIKPGTTTLMYGDAPGMNLDEPLDEVPEVDSLRINVEMKTYFMFNPSSSKDPNNDNSCIWYPVGNALSWEAGGQITYDPTKGRKIDRDAWTSSNGYYEMRPMVSEFPVWRGRVQHDPNDPVVVV